MAGIPARLFWIVVAFGCADARSTSPDPPAPRTPSQPAEPSAIGKAPDPGVVPARAVGSTEGTAASTTAPAPEPPALPDGTAIVPCEDPPEGMSCVPGGPFVRGTDDGPENTRPAERLWLQTFYMDRFEVTVEQYRACRAAGRCPKAGPRYTDFDHPKMPIQGVRWFDAVAYCEAQGKHLPTEAEWEKAARGPEGGLWPWGSEPATCERAIIQDESGRSCGLKKAISKPDTGRPWDVGSRPAGVYDLHDMVGNSWEWVSDWYSRSYADCGEPCRGIDPRGPCAGVTPCKGHSLKLVRGGSWYWDASRATGAYRRAHAPSNEPFHHFGFRCAASVDEVRRMAAGEPNGEGRPTPPAR